MQMWDLLIVPLWLILVSASSKTVFSTEEVGYRSLERVAVLCAAFLFNLDFISEILLQDQPSSLPLIPTIPLDEVRIDKDEEKSKFETKKEFKSRCETTDEELVRTS